MTRCTVVVLARDEERCLARCLDSVAGHGFDDVVVVDTGSVDGTREVVARFRPAGVRLVEQPWPGSFAAARTAALAAVTDGWVVFVDADEWLVQGAPARLRALLAGRDAAGPSPAVLAPRIVDAGRTSAVTDVGRVLPAGAGLRYRGPVHEYVVTSDGRPVPAEPVPIEFGHDGYDAGVMAAKDKRRRNAALLERARDEQPDEPRWAFFALRDGLPDLDAAGVHRWCDELARLAVARSDPAGPDRRDRGPEDARTLHRTGLHLACYALVAHGDAAGVGRRCAELDRLPGDAAADTCYFRTMLLLTGDTVTDHDLRDLVAVRRDPVRVAAGAIAPDGRHLDALIAAVLDHRRGPAEGDAYRELCEPWTDPFFAASHPRRARATIGRLAYARRPREGSHSGLVHRS